MVDQHVIKFYNTVFEIENSSRKCYINSQLASIKVGKLEKLGSEYVSKVEWQRKV